VHPHFPSPSLSIHASRTDTASLSLSLSISQHQPCHFLLILFLRRPSARRRSTATRQRARLIHESLALLEHSALVEVVDLFAPRDAPRGEEGVVARRRGGGGAASAPCARKLGSAIGAEGERWREANVEAVGKCRTQPDRPQLRKPAGCAWTGSSRVPPSPPPPPPFTWTPLDFMSPPMSSHARRTMVLLVPSPSPAKAAAEHRQPPPRPNWPGTRMPATTLLARSTCGSLL
jgi:hypothetical protein